LVPSPSVSSAAAPTTWADPRPVLYWSLTCHRPCLSRTRFRANVFWRGEQGGAVELSQRQTRGGHAGKRPEAPPGRGRGLAPRSTQKQERRTRTS